MMKAYREMVARQCSNNASPRRCREDSLKEAEKPDGQERVRFHLTTYGWNNCANKHTVRDADAREKLRSGSREAVPAHVHGAKQVRESRLSVRPVSRAQTSDRK